jgi:transposase
MKCYKNYIGIDISKNWLDIAVIRPNCNDVVEVKCDNNIKDLRLLKSKLKSRKINFTKSTLVVMEHIGVYKNILLKFLIAQKCSICIESALRIKRSLGLTRGKNDTIDAKRIAQYAITNQANLIPWKNPRTAVLKLKNLLSNRERFITALSMIETPLKELTKFHFKGDIAYYGGINNPVIKKIRESIKNIEAEIKLLIGKDEELNRQLILLTSIPGIGHIIAMNLICYTHEFTLFKTGKKLACYIGVAPFEHSSGISVNGRSRVSHLANKNLKKLFHMAALNQVQHKGELREYYDRKVAEGKKKMLVLNAIKNKLVLRVAAVMKRGTPYIKESEYIKKAVSARLA